MPKIVNCGYPLVPPDELLTKKEVAALMRVDKRTVERWVSMRRIAYIRIGGALRFSRREIIGALEEFQYGERRPPKDHSMG